MRLPKWDTASTMTAIALVFCAACAAWWVMRPSPPPPIALATPAPQVASIPTLTIHPAQVTVLAPKAKARLNLPVAVRDDPGQHVVAASRVDADLRPHTITSVLDADTGQVTTYDQAEPLPWLGITRRGEIGLAYGFRQGQPMGRLYLHQGLLDLKALRISGIAHLDQDGQWYTGISLAYRY